MSILTFSIYLVYWAYRSWKTLKAEAADPERLAAHPALSMFEKVNPALRTVALFAPAVAGVIPFINPLIPGVIGNGIMMYVLATLVLGIASLHPNQESFARKHSLVACGIVLALYLAFLSLSRLPGAWYLLSLLSVLPFAWVQQWLNEYWKAVEPDNLTYRSGFNGFELVALILGGLYLGFIVAGMMMGIK